MDKEPIFIFITRSFWLTFAGIVSLFSAGQEVLSSVAFFVAPLFGTDPVALTAILVKAAPIVLWLAALQQRSGAARPYTLRPGK